MSSDLYVGLSERSRLIIVTIGGLVATLNLAAAWWFAYSTEQSLALTEAAFKPYLYWFKESSALNLSSELRYDLVARAMHIVALGKLIANKQGIVLACFGAAFALAAIGFSLFIIGADGAFKVLAKSPAKASIAITGTAPGLLCFVISGWLVSVGVHHQSHLQLPPMRFEQTGSAPPTAIDAATCMMRDPVTDACTSKTSNQSP
jgi:hypothetical protein